MKKLRTSIILAVMSFLLLAFTSAQAKSANEIVGLYWSPKKDAKIEIYLKDKQYFGKFVWLANPKKDINNPVKNLQNRNVLGLELLTGFGYEDGVYAGGEIYDPETGKTYSCKMNIEGNMLKIRGYVGISLFGRTEYFTRVK